MTGSRHRRPSRRRQSPHQDRRRHRQHHRNDQARRSATGRAGPDRRTAVRPQRQRHDPLRRLLTSGSARRGPTALGRRLKRAQLAAARARRPACVCEAPPTVQSVDDSQRPGRRREVALTPAPVPHGRSEKGAGHDFAHRTFAQAARGTLPAWRGRSVFRSLVRYRAALASAQGFRYLQVDASAQSRPILHRRGFVQLAPTTPFISPAAST